MIIYTELPFGTISLSWLPTGPLPGSCVVFPSLKDSPLEFEIAQSVRSRDSLADDEYEI